MCNKFDRGLLYTAVAVLIANTVLIEKLDARVSKVEKRGEVEAFLEPLPQVAPKVKVLDEYSGPKLYNNHTKIVFNDKKEFDCLAENIYYESRGEPYIGKIAVAHTTFNRAEKVGSFCEVVHKPHQFSWTLKEQKKPHGKEWFAARHAAMMFSNGVRVKNLEEVEHYHTAKVNPIWDNSMTQVATIGGHQFYGE